MKMRILKQLGWLAAISALLIAVPSCTETTDDSTGGIIDGKPSIDFVNPKKNGALGKSNNITVAFHDDVALASGKFDLMKEDGTVLKTIEGALTGKDDTLVYQNDGTLLEALKTYKISAKVTDKNGTTVDDEASFTTTDAAFEQQYTEMYYKGGANDWGNTPFVLTANNVWTLDSLQIVGGGNQTFKLADNTKWLHLDWGMADGEEKLDFSSGAAKMALKEVSAEVDADGKKIDATEKLIRGGNIDAVIHKDDLTLGNNYYKLTFYEKTDELKLEYIGPAVAKEIPNTIGVIGSALTGDDTGWTTDLEQQMTLADTTNGIWKVVLDLKAGQLKFRYRQSWDSSWGAAVDAPLSGEAVLKGENITIPKDGKYELRITADVNADPLGNGTYEIVEIKETTIGIIGSAAPFGWVWDSNMTEISAGAWEITLDLKDGNIKFRANDGWDKNWGSGDTDGVGNLGGTDIPVTAGSYKLTVTLADPADLGSEMKYTVVKQ